MEPEASSSSPIGIWGYLEPLVPSPNVHRINFTQRSIDIGRSEGNYAKFMGAAVSKSHATIEWNGRTDTMSVVTITDHNTTNGTFVDGVKVEGINVHRLFDGCTVFFGSKVPVVTEQEDYRFTFHHAFGRAKTESLFSHYTLGDRLGGGLHGYVYRAVEKSSGKVFAVKTAWKHDNNASITAAGQETMALMVTAHPNIVKLHEVFFHIEGLLNDMVLEYVDGINLQELVTRTLLSELHAKELSSQLCLAITHAHEKGVSHGDLKPDNVLVTRGSPPVIKVLDFGLANVLGSYNMDPVPCGFPNRKLSVLIKIQVITNYIFTAPEAQRQGVDPSNAQMQKWDDWGVGYIIFTLLSSQHPFPPREGGLPFNPAIDQISWDALSEKSDEAQDLVRKLLCVDPADRLSVGDTWYHPWLAGHQPYQHSFPSVSSLEPLPRDDSDSDDMEAVEESPVPGKGQGRMQPPRALKRLKQPRSVRSLGVGEQDLARLVRARPGPMQLRGRPRRF
ncbi:kinase-like domain-containing protein [Mycena capillaripes]|nr:kinase-like domain-containing protein [Mycena capillaripes]